MFQGSQDMEYALGLLQESIKKGGITAAEFEKILATDNNFAFHGNDQIVPSPDMCMTRIEYLISLSKSNKKDFLINFKHMQPIAIYYIVSLIVVNVIYLALQFNEYIDMLTGDVQD